MPVPAATVLRVFLILASLPGTQRHIARLVKGAREWWSGKQIAVIGPTASGKDSFLARLQNKPIPEVHAHSGMNEKVQSFKVNLVLPYHQVVDITCKGVINVGGEADFRDAPEGWLSVCKKADVIFYVMTIGDLTGKKFLRRGRVRQDLDWLLTSLPHFKPESLVHVLVNKVDEEIASHTDYDALARELTRELRALDRNVKKVLHPYEARYTGATLISMKNKAIYTLAINDAFGAVYSALHEPEPVEGPSIQEDIQPARPLTARPQET